MIYQSPKLSKLFQSLQKVKKSIVFYVVLFFLILRYLQSCLVLKSSDKMFSTNLTTALKTNCLFSLCAVCPAFGTINLSTLTTALSKALT